MKRFACLAMLLMLVLATLPACGAANTPTQAATEAPSAATNAPTEAPQPETLTVWWWGEGDTPGSQAWLQETVEAYKQVHPEITIDLVEQTTDQLYPAWEAAITAKQGPDIQFLWTGVWALQYVWDGQVADLTDLIPESEMQHWVGTDGISYQGKPWLVPWYRISIVMLYNKDILEQAGLNPDQPPTNWDEFLSACEAIKPTGKIPFEQGGMKDAWGAAWLFSTFAPAMHDNIGDFIGAATVADTFTKPEYTDWLDKLSQLDKTGCSDPQTMSLDFFQGREAFHQGNAAFGLATNGQAIQWIEEMGGEDHIGVMRFPAFGNGAMAGGLNVQTHSFAIPEFSPNKQEAADFLMFMHTPDRLQRWYELTNNLPADDRFDPSILKTSAEKYLYQYLQDDSIPWSEIYIPVQVDEEGVYAAVQAIYSGRTPAEAAQMIENAAAKWRSVDPVGVDDFIKWATDYSK